LRSPQPCSRPASPPPLGPPGGRFARHLLATTVHLSTFEVRQDGTDRFEHCPPAGDIGQATLPPIPEWHPSAAPAPTDTAVDAPSDTVAAGGVPASASTLTWEAIKATSSGFRSCYHRGLLYDHEQDGHVSVVLRVDATGRVARAETWGVCGLTPVAPELTALGERGPLPPSDRWR